MAKLSQGTQIYAVLPTGTDDALEIVKIAGVTSFAPGGQPADQIETTDLEETDSKQYMRGLKSPAAATMGINVDGAQVSHTKLFDVFQREGDVQFKLVVGWSDGKDIPPTLTGSNVVLPETRTWSTMDVYIADFPFDFATNSIVSGQISLQRSGKVAWIQKV